MKTSVVAFAVLAVGLASGAQAQQTTFRCIGKDGKKYYASTVPPQCAGQTIEQINAQGTVVRRIEPDDEASRLAREAEAAKKREAEAAVREEQRRNRALLATYTSEKDIEEARTRAIAENEKAMKQIEGRIAEIRKRQVGFEKEMEFYQDAPKTADKSGKPRPPDAKPKAAPKPPPKLVEDMRTAELDMSTQQSMLDAKKKEVAAINSKYDEDKKRYLELTGKGAKK